MTDEAKREELKQRIEDGEARQRERTLGDRANDARDTAVDFVKEHPIATVAGGVAAGALLAMLFSNRRLGERSAAAANAAIDLAVAYGLKALDAAEDAARFSSDKLEDLGDNVSDRGRSLRREVKHRAGDASDAVRRTSRGASKSASRTARNLRDRIGV